MAHIGALRAWGGRPPVGVKVVIEGMEEAGGGALTAYPPQHPEMFGADVMIIADMGNIRPGEPTLTVTLRGTASVTVEVPTLASAKHSGSYGGAAPDALLALTGPWPRCTTTTATSRCTGCGAKSGPARVIPKRSSARWPMWSTGNH